MWTRFHHKVRSSPTTRTCPHLASAPSLPSLRSGHSWWLPLVTGVPTSPSVVTAEPQPLTVQQVKLGQHTLSVSVPPTSSLLRPHFTLLSHLLSSPLSLSSSLSLSLFFLPSLLLTMGSLLFPRSLLSDFLSSSASSSSSVVLAPVVTQPGGNRAERAEKAQIIRPLDSSLLSSHCSQPWHTSCLLPTFFSATSLPLLSCSTTFDPQLPPPAEGGLFDLDVTTSGYSCNWSQVQV